MSKFEVIGNQAKFCMFLACFGENTIWAWCKILQRLANRNLVAKEN